MRQLSFSGALICGLGIAACSGTEPSIARDGSGGTPGANGGSMSSGGTGVSAGGNGGASTGTGGRSGSSGGSVSSSGGSAVSSGGATSSGGTNTATGGAAGGNPGSSGGASGSGGTQGATGGRTGAGGVVVVGVPVEAPLTGNSGEFVDVTPSSVSNPMVLDVLADPARPGAFFAFFTTHGVFESRDWGATWAKVSTDGQIEHGIPWGQAIAPDGTYMLASVGYPDNGNHGAWKSTDRGKTWKAYTISQDNDPYNFDIDSTNANHVITTMHAKPNIYESFDGGQTWADRGSYGGGGSAYVFFITSTTWISIPQDGDGAQTRRTTNSGGSWSNVSTAQHAHGNAMIYIDPSTRDVFIGGHTNGVFRSTNDGESFTNVSSTRASIVFGTDRYIYAMDPGATQDGTAPFPQRAARSAPTAWQGMQYPPAMNNGMKRAATAYDTASKRWVIVGGNWYEGIWRYIEQPQD